MTPYKNDLWIGKDDDASPEVDQSHELGSKKTLGTKAPDYHNNALYTYVSFNAKVCSKCESALWGS